MNTTNPTPNGRAEFNLLQRFESELMTRKEAAIYLASLK